MVFGRWLDKPQRLKAQLSLWSCPWWKVIIGICRNLLYKGLALTRWSGDFSPGKTIDWHLVSPWYDFTQLTGIKRYYHARAQRPSTARPVLIRAPVCPSPIHWENWQESPQLLAGTSWEPEGLYHPLKCLSHSKHYIYYDKFLNRDWKDHFSSYCRGTRFSLPPSLEA